MDNTNEDNERKEYSHRYYETHHEEIKESQRRYRKSHPEKIRECRRRYREAHREELREYRRKYYQEHKDYFREQNRKRREQKGEYISEYNQKLREKQRRAVLDLLGGKCVICNRTDSKTKLIVHERYGKPHGTSYIKMLKHLEDFIVLCLPHHSMVHRLKNEGKMEAMIEVLQDLGIST